MTVKLNDAELRILQALICGKIRTDVFNDRFNLFGHAVSAGLIAKKLISFDGSYYQLTINGREAIPKETTKAAKVETMRVSDIESSLVKYEIKPFSRPKPVNKKPKTLQVLEFIEANPNCNGGFIGDSLGIERPINFIKSYIDKEQVVVTGKTGRGCRPQYRLAKDITVKSIYKKGFVKETLPAEKEPAAPIKNEVAEQEIANHFVDIKKMVEPSLDKNADDEYETVIAYDSWKRLSIDGYELTQKQTSELLIFVHELGLVG
jgi:hypothetical protein